MERRGSGVSIQRVNITVEGPVDPGQCSSLPRTALIEEEASHLEGGGVILSVPAADPDERQQAPEILRAHDASGMRYFADATYGDLL